MTSTPPTKPVGDEPVGDEPAEPAMVETTAPVDPGETTAPDPDAHWVSFEAAPNPSRPTGIRSRHGLVALIAVAVVLAAGLAVGLSIGLSGGSTAGPAVSVSNEVVSVTTGTIKQTVDASGTLEAAQQSDVNFAVSGTVTAVDVKAGQTVTVGQALATVGTGVLQADVDAAQANVDAADARLDSDESAGADAVQIDSDEASVTSAQSSLTTAETNLSDATLTSPIAGTVATLDLAVGQQISGSGGGGGGAGAGASNSSAAASDTSTAEVTVIDTSAFLVDTTVDDTQISQVVQGDQVDVTQTGSTTIYYGTVSNIGLIASSSTGVATFPVTVTLDGNTAGLFPGSSVTASIIVKEVNNAVEVPTAAISYTTSGQATVTLVSGGNHITRTVAVGTSSDDETQILSGVKSGQKVLEKVVHFSAGTGSGGRSLFGGTGVPAGAGFSRFGGAGGFGGGGGVAINGG